MSGMRMTWPAQCSLNAGLGGDNDVGSLTLLMNLMKSKASGKFLNSA